MKIYKITEASKYLGVSINTLKTLANNGKIKSFKTAGDRNTVAEVVNGQIPVFDLNTNSIRQFSPETPVRETEIIATVRR